MASSIRLRVDPGTGLRPWWKQLNVPGLCCAKHYRQVFHLIDLVDEALAQSSGFPAARLNSCEGNNVYLPPPATLKHPLVLVGSNPVRAAAKPECLIHAVRIPVDVVGVLVANPSRMSLQIDLRN